MTVFELYHRYEIKHINVMNAIDRTDKIEIVRIMMKGEFSTLLLTIKLQSEFGNNHRYIQLILN